MDTGVPAYVEASPEVAIARFEQEFSEALRRLGPNDARTIHLSLELEFARLLRDQGRDYRYYLD